VRVKAKWEGRDKVMARLRSVLPATEQELASTQVEVARELANRIKPRAPVRTGRYRDSIEGAKLSSRPGDKFIGRGKTKDPNATGIFADFRWRWLEFGTVRMPARPHIFPTYRAYRKELRRKMANAVNKAVRRARKK
jgi:HK97 gp10 family phage protein